MAVGVALPANRRVILLVVQSAQIRRIRAPLVQEEHGLPQVASDCPSRAPVPPAPVQSPG